MAFKGRQTAGLHAHKGFLRVLSVLSVVNDLNFYYGNAGTAALALKDKTFRQNLTEENVLAQSM